MCNRKSFWVNRKWISASVGFVQAHMHMVFMFRQTCVGFVNMGSKFLAIALQRFAFHCICKHTFQIRELLCILCKQHYTDEEYGAYFFQRNKDNHKMERNNTIAKA